MVFLADVNQCKNVNSAKGFLDKNLIGLLIIIATLLVTVGCAGNYGRFQRSQEVNEIFSTYQVLPDHRYYFSGPVGRPDAIMGIHRDYALETTQWTEVAFTETLLKKWVDWMDFHFDKNVRYYPYGSLILDPNGKRLGIWYSIWDWTPVILNENNRIEVYPPGMKDPLNDPGDIDRDSDKLH